MRLIAESWQAARQRHVCDACLGVIGPGDQYYRQRIADVGDVWTWKAHALCDALTDALREPFDYELDVSLLHEAISGLLGGLLGFGGRA